MNKLQNTLLLGSILLLTACGGLIPTPNMPGSQTSSITCFGCDGGITVNLSTSTSTSTKGAEDDGDGKDGVDSIDNDIGNTSGTGPTNDSTTMGSVLNPDPDPDTSADVDRIKKEEGLRLTPYFDTEGFPHIGYGHKLTEEEAEILLEQDLVKAEKIAKTVVGAHVWSGLSQVRKHVLIETAFVLGETGLKGFDKMLEALEKGDYEGAASELLNSKWGKEQAPARVERLADSMRTNS